nr:dockerin type I domain-containing protein [uncultured Desulfobacter sp.]
MNYAGWFKKSTIFICLFLILFVAFPALAANDSICARVRIQIDQELTLERQAFDAHMRINNGLSTIALENVGVDVLFYDENGSSVLASSDPNNTAALFFIRLESMENIDDVSGTGTVAPSTSADIHWLIIPSVGASKGLEAGTLYYVGARLSYTANGQEQEINVAPDYIFVKPLPVLALDYFLPEDVYGDDAFTTEIEGPIPFTLGVRIKNNGGGWAANVAIDSAQPKIVDNDQGLLVNFMIVGSEVNGVSTNDSLLVSFGNIAPHTSGTARWEMECSLSGKFIDFQATISHADELGGELTSVIDTINTHVLLHDVLVDIGGRDDIRDFLAKDGTLLTVYESDSLETIVTDVSEDAAIQLVTSGADTHTYTLTVPVASGFAYLELPDPQLGQQVIAEVVRSDGKIINLNNAWLSKRRDDNQAWQYLFNLFDANPTGSYTIVLQEPGARPQPPVLEFIPNRNGVEDRQVSFIVEASDPNGTTPVLSAAPLPPGATFVDQGDGTAIFDWTPMVGQAGRYSIRYTASDGVLQSTRRAVLTICNIDDSDCDGMNDQWELDHFGTLDRDGTGDYDGDGISDLDEYLNGTDPTETQNAPSVPVINAPLVDEIVPALQPELSVLCSTDADGDILTYEFEVYSDSGYTTLVANDSNVQESGLIAPWIVPEELAENQIYYWRVRAFDGTAYSFWTHGRFLVSETNEAPCPVELLTPENLWHADSIRPTLVSGFSTDPENDSLTYTFAVYADQTLNSLITSGQGTVDENSGMVSWQVNADLTNGSLYYWQVTVEDADQNTITSNAFSFTVDTVNQTPPVPEIDSPAVGSEVNTTSLVLSVISVTDPDGDDVTYDFEMDVLKDFSSESLIRSSPDEITILDGTVQWQHENLIDSTVYYWRARSRDSVSASQWVCGQFFVNTYNDEPNTPVLKNPGNLSWTDQLLPVLSVHPAEEPDNDTVEMIVEVYTDEDLTDLIFEGSSEDLSLTVSQELENASWYYWRARLMDAHGVEGEWSAVQSFFVKEDANNDPPTITLTTPEADTVITVDGSDTVFSISWEDTDTDSNAQISLYYDTDTSDVDGILITSGILEDPDGTDDTYEWNLSGVAGGTYYLYALISDGSSSVVDHAAGAIHINYPPLAPSSPAPSDAETGISVDLSLSWTGGDPDADDMVTYTVQYKPENGEFAVCEACEDILGTKCKLPLLSYDTTYLWQVLATDGYEQTTLGSVWQFTTFTGIEDADDDDLSNELEIDYGTDPFDPDTDKDGYYDGEEVYADTDPLDAGSRPSYPPRYGDINQDGDIDGEDLASLISVLHLTSSDDGFNTRADFNSDGVIDELDVELFTRVYGYLLP